MKRKKGSAIVIVVIITLTISAYINSAVFSNNNFGIMLEKYDDIIQNVYGENMDSINVIYDDLVKMNK